MLKGSCLCGAVTYEVDTSLEKATHCHCSMCRKAHGAAFATYTIVSKKSFRFTTGEADVAAYRSSPEVVRTFYRRCGSNLQFLRDGRDTQGLALGSLDSALGALPVDEIFTEAQPSWYQAPVRHG
nr:GFA family protein [Pseudomonas luteola]